MYKFSSVFLAACKISFSSSGIWYGFNTHDKNILLIIYEPYNMVYELYGFYI